MTNSSNPIPFRQGMTLMPGQSASMSIQLPPEIGERLGSGGFHFQEVPPPAKAPVQNRAQELGLPDGLRVEGSRHGQWRCSGCSKMQPQGSEQVWVPDSVRQGDPAWSVTEAARQNAYNGHFSAWCVPCTRKFGKSLASRIADVAQAPVLTQNYPNNPFPLAFACVMLFGGLLVIALVWNWN